MANKKFGTGLGFLALVMVVITTVLWFRQANLVAIPEDRTLWVAAFLVAAATGVASFVIGTRWFGGIPAIIAILAGMFLTATIAISKQEVAENPIKIGDTIPYFTAIDDQGDRYTSNALAGTPVLIKFFRAHW